MSTPLLVNAASWVRQALSPIIDGNYPNSVRDNIISFFGYEHTNVTSITPSITLKATSNEMPKIIMASASGTTAAGSRTESSLALNPYLDLQYRWKLTYADDSPVEDLEGITDPRDGSAVNIFDNDSCDPEFSCIVREAGDYKLTLYAEGMTSTPLTVRQEIATELFTVTEDTNTHNWYDGTNGNDANDGLDPYGFALTTAIYTESTKELTQAGAFTSYDHTAATTGRFTNRYNYIYIDKAGFEGLYRIESKTDSDTIVLSSGLGSDQTSVTSSDGPKEIYDGLTVDKNFYHLRGGNTYTLANDWRIHFNPNANGMIGYDGVPVVTKATGTIVLLSYGGSNTPADTVIISGVEINGQGNSGCILGIASSLTESSVGACAFDNILVQKSVGATPVNLQYIGTSREQNILFLGGTLDGRELDTARGTNQHAMFSAVHLGAWFRVLGTTFNTDSDNAILDHFWYPSGDNNHLHSKYNNFSLSDTGTSYCMNTNRSDTGIADYQSICYNMMGDQADWGIDFSNASNDPTDKQFRNSRVSNNKSNVQRGFSLHYSLIEGAFTYNDIYKTNNTDNQIWLGGGAGFDPNDYQAVVYKNRSYGARLFNYLLGSYLESLDNEVVVPDSTTVGAIDPADQAGRDLIVDINQFYAPSGAEITADSVDEAIDDYNTTYSTDNITTEPSWNSVNDPANGDFGGVPTGLTVVVI